MPELESLGSIPAAVAGVALLLFAAWGAAGLCPGVDRRREVDAALVRCAVGLSLVAWAGIALGMTGLLTGGRPVAVLAAFCIAAAVQEWRYWWPCKTAGKRTRVTWTLRIKRTAWLPLLAALLTLGPALCYPVGWDELVYHCTLPRRWLADGRPAVYPDLPYSGFPSLGEILFWLIGPVESLIAPRLTGWVCWMLSLWMLYRLLRRRLSRGLSTGMTMVFALAPATLMISANCYVESILLMDVAAVMLSVTSAVRGQRTSGYSLPVVLGVLAGGAAAVKLTGLAVVAMPMLWWAGHLHRGARPARASLRWGGVYLLVALVVATPFYLRPWLATGNPASPYLAEWFTGDAQQIETGRYHHAIGGARFGVRSVASFVTGPVLLAFNDRLYDGSFGWQMLGLLALAGMAAVRLRRSRGMAGILWPAAIAIWLYVTWYVSAQQARFAVPAAFALTVVAGAALAGLPRRPRRMVMALLAAATIFSLPWKAAGYYLGSWETVAGYWTWTEYVDDNTDGAYLPVVRALDELPTDARIALLFEHRGLYLQRPHVIVTPFYQSAGFTPPEAFTNPNRVLDLLRSENATHVVMARLMTGPDVAPAWAPRLEPLLAALAECERRGDMKVVWESDNYLLMEVRPGDE